MIEFVKGEQGLGFFFEGVPNAEVYVKDWGLRVSFIGGKGEVVCLLKREGTGVNGWVGEREKLGGKSPATYMNMGRALRREGVGGKEGEGHIIPLSCRRKKPHTSTVQRMAEEVRGGLGLAWFGSCVISSMYVVVMRNFLSFREWAGSQS